MLENKNIQHFGSPRADNDVTKIEIGIYILNKRKAKVFLVTYFFLSFSCSLVLFSS